MARTKIDELSTVAAENTDINGINTGEGWLAKDINNAFRELMAQLRRTPLREAPLDMRLALDVYSRPEIDGLIADVAPKAEASTYADAQATPYLSIFSLLTILGYSSAGDCPPAYYKRAFTQPTHPGWIRTADRFRSDGVADSINGGYWEYANWEVLPPHFNAMGTGLAEHVEIRNAIAVMVAQNKGLNGLGRKYYCGERLTFTASGTYKTYNGTISFENCPLPATDWRYIQINGTTPTVLGNLTADAASGQRILVVDSAAYNAVNGGDFLCVSSSALFGSVGAVKSEFFTASGKGAGTNIFSDHEFNATYLTANTAYVERIPLNITVDWRMNIIGPTFIAPGRGMHIQYCKIENLPETVQDMIDGGVDLYGCKCGEITEPITVKTKPWARDLTVTVVDFAANRFTVPNHFLQVTPTFMQFLVTSSGTLPAGLSAGVAYTGFVIDANTIQFSTDFTSAGTGTITLQLSVRQYGVGYAGCFGGTFALIAGENLRHTVTLSSGPLSSRYVVTRDIRHIVVTGNGNIASPYDQHEGVSDCGVERVSGSLNSQLLTEESVTIQGANASVGAVDLIGGGGPLLLIQSTGTGDDRPNIINIGHAKGNQIGTNGFLAVVDTSVGITDQPISVNIQSLGGVGASGIEIRPTVSPIDCFVGKMAGRLRGGFVGQTNTGTKAARLTIDHVDIDRTASVNWDYNFYEQGGSSHVMRVNSGIIRDASGTGGFKINNRTLGGKISLGPELAFPTAGATFKNVSGGGDVYRDSQAVATS